ncbi:hypothetical protein SESBI_18581 [Sesbania bispinosa]|nr:hypothetical protein SESBI_18581 [Sesbania bispinosa]
MGHREILTGTHTCVEGVTSMCEGNRSGPWWSFEGSQVGGSVFGHRRELSVQWIC